MDQQFNPNIQPNPPIQPIPPVVQPPKNIWKIAILVIVGILVLGGAAWGGYYWWQNRSGSPTACTLDAKQCSDGSYVGRSGPNCEFAACPMENKNKIYSVDELVKSNLEEGTEVLVKGKYGIELINTGPDYEGPGGGSYLFGQTEKLQISSNGLPNTEINQIITVKGKVKYCGGKKIPKYLCALTDIKVIDETANWQSYRNENLGLASFEVKYPAGYSIASKTNDLVTIEKPKNCSGDSYCFPMKIEIKSLYNQGGLNIEDWFKEAGKMYTQTGTKTIGGKSAIMAAPKETEGFGTRYIFGGGNILPSGTPQYIFDILIYSGIEDSLKNQILSTFKFTK